MVAVRQNVTVPFAQGLDLKSDDFQLPPGKLSLLENAAFDKLGAISKRTGHDVVVSGSPLAEGVGIGNYRGQTLVSDGKRLYQVQGSALKDLGGVSAAFRLTQTPVLSAGRILNASTSASSSCVCTAIESPTGVKVVVQDSTGAQVATYDFPGTSRPQMVYFTGLSKHILAVRDAVNGVRLYVLDPSTQSYQTQWIDQNARGQFSIWADSSHVYVAVSLLHTIFLERFYVWNNLLYPLDVVTETSAMFDFPLMVTGCQVDSDRSIILWIEPNNTVFMAVAQNGSIVQTKFAIFFAPGLRNAAAIYDGASAHIYLDVQQSSAWLLWHMVVRSDLKAIASNSTIGGAVSLAAKPFLSGDRIIVPVISRSENQRRCMLLDGVEAQVLARFDDLTQDAPGQGSLGAVHSVGNKSYLCQTLAENAGAAVSVGVADTSLGAFYGQEIANGFYFLLGSRLHRFDGERVTEDGFDIFPDRAQFPNSTGDAHSYQYRVVWSWTDASGLTHWSAPSPNVTYKTANPIGPGASHVNPIKLPAYLLPTLKGDVRVHLFRTEDKGTEFYEVTSRLSSEAAGGDTVSVTDATTDSQLVGSDVFGASLPDPAPCTMAAQQRGLVPPALAGATLTTGGGLPIGVNRYYVLTALSPNGETLASHEVAGSHITLSGPPEKRSFTVLWSSHSAASGYKLYRSDAPGGPYQLLVELPAGSTSYLDDGSAALVAQAPPNSNTTASGKFAGATPLAVPSNIVATHYDPKIAGSLNGSPTWRVTAVNARGETMASIGVGGLSWWTLIGESVDISWDTVGGATSYKVYRGPGDNVGLEGYIATVSAPTTTFRDDGSIAPGSACPTSDTSADGSGTVSTQYYRVSAVNETGETLASTEASIALRYSDTPCGVLVSWARIPGAAKYRLYGRSTGAELLLVETAETSWLDTNTETPSGALPTSNTTGPRPYSGGPALYTAGGVIPNMPASPTGFLVEHQKRLWGIDSANPLRLWFTNKASYGYPLEGNPLLLTLDLPAAGGDCIGLASLDDKLLIFKRQCILWTNGSGPDPTGVGEFAEPVLLTADVGLLDPRSIVMTPAGIMFRSPKGIYLIDRALGCSYIGAPAEDLWLSTDTVRSAVLCALDNEVRWYLPGTSGTETARAIVYHYLVGQWSLHKIAVFGVKDAHVNPITGLVEMVGPFGQVYRDNRASYLDPGFYAMKIRTGWLSLGQLNGYGRMHRLQLLAHWLSAHNLVVALEFDNESNSQSVAIPALLSMTPERWQVNPRTHRCESVRVTIEDADGVGASCSLSALTFEVSLKPGVKRLGSTKKFAAT